MSSRRHAPQGSESWQAAQLRTAGNVRVGEELAGPEVVDASAPGRALSARWADAAVLEHEIPAVRRREPNEVRGQTDVD